jgi:hypothetical protein
MHILIIKEKGKKKKRKYPTQKSAGGELQV